jgi:hypothetical protein
LAIAANTTVFNIVDGLLWGVLPVREARRLVTFTEGRTGSYPDYLDYRDQTREVFEGGVCAHAFVPASLGGGGEPERVWGLLVTGNYFATIGATPAFGRGIQPDEDTVVDRDAVIVLSHALWRRRYASDPRIIGRDVVVNGRRYSVVGVAPPGFTGTDHGVQAQFWIPLAML